MFELAANSKVAAASIFLEPSIYHRLYSMSTTKCVDVSSHGRLNKTRILLIGDFGVP